MDLISLSSQYYQVLENLYNSGDESVARRDLVISDVDANSAFSYIPYGTSLVDFTAGEPFDAYPKQETDREIFSMYYMNTQRLQHSKLEICGLIRNTRCVLPRLCRFSLSVTANKGT